MSVTRCASGLYSFIHSFRGGGGEIVVKKPCKFPKHDLSLTQFDPSSSDG